MDDMPKERSSANFKIKDSASGEIDTNGFEEMSKVQLIEKIWKLQGEVKVCLLIFGSISVAPFSLSFHRAGKLSS